MHPLPRPAAIRWATSTIAAISLLMHLCVYCRSIRSNFNSIALSLFLVATLLTTLYAPCIEAELSRSICESTACRCDRNALHIYCNAPFPRVEIEHLRGLALHFAHFVGSTFEFSRAAFDSIGNILDCSAFVSKITTVILPTCTYSMRLVNCQGFKLRCRNAPTVSHSSPARVCAHF